MERCINRLKPWRRIATPDEGLATNDLAVLTATAILLLV